MGRSPDRQTSHRDDARFFVCLIFPRTSCPARRQFIYFGHFYTKKDAHGEAIFKKDYLMGLGKYDKPRNRNVSQELLTYSRLFSEMDKFKDKRIINLDLNSLTDRFVKDNSLDIYV